MIRAANLAAQQHEGPDGARCRDFQVRIDSDSQSAVFGFNRLSFRSGQLQQMLLRIYLEASSLGIAFVANHLPREQNREADFLSKTVKDSGDYQLTNEAWERAKAELKFARSDLRFDLFASRSNHLSGLPYASRFPDSHSAYHDALTLDWRHLPGRPDQMLWIFPPLGVIGRALALLLQFKQDAIVILPQHQDKPWQGLLERVPKRGSVYLGPNSCRANKLLPAGIRVASWPFWAHKIVFD